MSASVGTGFGGHADARVQALLDGSKPVSTTPLEWLPLLLVAALIARCRIAGTTILV
jgi:hypothetical protein